MASKNERELKVCALSGHNYKPVPSIRLMGQWLEAAGFHIGDWDMLERKQVKLWMDEKAEEIKEAENTSTFKIESLSNNFRNRKRSLEQKIIDTSSESIRRMYTSELESATESYELKVAEIRKKVDQTDIHTTLIANGILEVVN